MKKSLFKNSFAIKTVISAAILIAVFIALFFVFFNLNGEKHTIEDTYNEISSSDVGFSSSTESFSSDTEQTPSPELIISSPERDNITVTENSFSLLGSCNPNLPLYINEKAVSVSASGDFSEDITLERGENIIKIVQGDKTITKTVFYRYVIIKDYSPSGSASYTSGSNIVVSVTARNGSSVSASFNGKTVTLTKKDNSSDEFVAFYGMFSLPKDNLKDQKLGKIKFSGKLGSTSESFYSGEITVKKTTAVSTSDPSATPSGSNYIDVGSGYIAEIMQFQAETFDGKYTASNADWSRPTNNYLPKGTVDYCSTGLVYDSSGERSYITLRCGKRVYYERTDNVTKKTSKVTKQYVGKLPDHNELSVVSFDTEQKHTYLTLDTDWKAPFTVALLPQSYVQPSYQDYRIESATFSYLDITFCYATVFKGEIKIPADHPIFKKAEIIKNKSECVLRLHLKEKGAFYGWDAYYNDEGQLCFSFLNPAYTTTSNNSLGIDLSGVTVFVDVGHGGSDAGALGINPKKLTESKANLKLALYLESELKKAGAKVVLSRRDDSALSADDRQKMLKDLAPDLCVSIHHDANNSSKLNGFGSFYFNAFSKKAAEYVYNRTIATGLYNQKSNNRNRLDWHYFFLARTSTCPVVLTENGYMTNSGDFSVIQSDANMKTKAKAIAEGVADYFKSICPKGPIEPPNEEPESSTPSSNPSSEPPSSEPSSDFVSSLPPNIEEESSDDSETVSY